MKLPLAAGLALVLLPLAACQMQPAALTDADRQAIEQARAAFVQGVMAKDWGAVAGIYHENATLMQPNMPAVVGRSAIQAMFTQFPGITSFDLRQVEVEGLGDLATVYGRYSMTFTLPGDTAVVADSGKYVETWRRQTDGTWQIMWDIYNSDVPLPAPPQPPPARRG